MRLISNSAFRLVDTYRWSHASRENSIIIIIIARSPSSSSSLFAINKICFALMRTAQIRAHARTHARQTGSHHIFYLYAPLHICDSLIMWQRSDFFTHKSSEINFKLQLTHAGQQTTESKIGRARARVLWIFFCFTFLHTLEMLREKKTKQADCIGLYIK